ncbi:serum response factor homolog B-like [Cotesia glomerata]|uniref:Uncharacterized protein n=1 Tax=Cotesia glomerata TaxID=32391 RepID=A0AAV7IG55_COTGL|nr:serum response factor homolog B-like [Cotesia glomerata]KAH0552518.1 hypothetical protein KQX54_011518 [Cotesia glomerata]
MQEHLMSDEQFLAHQMSLAHVGDGFDEGMDGDFEDDDLEFGGVPPNHIQNIPVVPPAPNQDVIQDDPQNDERINPNDNGDNNLVANRPGNPSIRQGNDPVANGGVDQNNAQGGHQNNNGRDNNQQNNNVPALQNVQVINQGLGRGNQIRFQRVHQAYNNAAAGDGNLGFVQRNVGFGNLRQPRSLIRQNVLQPYPQGHAVFGHHQGVNRNIRYPSGFQRQRLLTPVEATRAARLKGIIDNLEYELQQNREVYRRLYGSIPGGHNRDAGYWKNKFFQEKKRNSNQGKNLYFFNSK